MKIIKTIDEIDDNTITNDYSCDGMYIPRSSITGNIERLDHILKDENTRTEQIVLINHPHLDRCILRNRDTLISLVERVPNLILSSSDGRLLYDLRFELKKKGKKLLIATPYLSKGTNYYLFPHRERHSYAMYQELDRLISLGFNLIINEQSFNLPSNIYLKKIDKESNGNSIVYSKNPSIIMNMLR